MKTNTKSSIELDLFISSVDAVHTLVGLQTSQFYCPRQGLRILVQMFLPSFINIQVTKIYLKPGPEIQVSGDHRILC